MISLFAVEDSNYTPLHDYGFQRVEAAVQFVRDLAPSAEIRIDYRN
jgi:hypothetical protein